MLPTNDNDISSNDERMTENQTANKTERRFREGLLVYSMPFWYGVITRLPFIYFVIHMRFQFDMDWKRIGFMVGSYQASRVVTGIFTTTFTGNCNNNNSNVQIIHFLATAIALAGNILVLSSPNEEQIPFLFGTIVIGFAETLACMQTYLKDYYLSDDIDVVGHKLKVQYAWVAIGVTFAFAFGGVIYEIAGINGIAIFGSIAAFMELLSLIAYTVLGRGEEDDQDVARADGVAKNNGLDLENQKKDRISALRRSSRFIEGEPSSDLFSLIGYDTDDDSDSDEDHEDEDNNHESSKGHHHTKEEEEATSPPPPLEEEDLQKMQDYFSRSGLSPNYINYVLCFTFGMEAITIGYNLAVSPVYITEQFGKNTTTIGIMLAAGAATGTLVSIGMTLTKYGKTFTRRYLPDPYGFIFAMVGISVAVMLAAIPVFPVHFIGLLFLMGFNDYAAILLNELQGSVTSADAYRTIAPKGQIVRRCTNVLTAISGPILYNILPTLPYIVAGGITLTWTIILVVVIRRRMNMNKKIIFSIQEKEGLSNALSNDDVKGMIFAKQEVLARLMKRRFIPSGKVQDYLPPKKIDMP